jgi:hypothetical protein
MPGGIPSIGTKLPNCTPTNRSATFPNEKPDCNFASGFSVSQGETKLQLSHHAMTSER